MDRHLQIGHATLDDLDSWMELVEMVQWNFPGLETQQLLNEYKETVIKNIKRNSAICAKIEKTVAGVLLFSTKHNMICCMAVHPDYRKQGIATLMIQLMFENLDNGRDINVTTFRGDDEKGIAPRALYKKLGFEEDELVEEFGYPLQKFVLHRK